MRKIIVLSAHPDDETIGLGGTILKHTMRKEEEVYVVCFTDGTGARHDQSDLQKKIFFEACENLGAKGFCLDFPDQQLDKYSIFDIIKSFDHIYNDISPEVIYTHSHGDVNQDHRRVFEVALVLARSYPKNKVRSLISYEVPSSTEWYPSQLDGFTPNLYIDITSQIEKKIEVLKLYENTFCSEIKEYPHPRSLQSLRAMNMERGSRVGVSYAEAFSLLREIR
jgi:N-acetylglucosamine malate deacetylase 1